MKDITPQSIEYIIELIYKSIIANLSAQEQDELEVWRKADPRNEATYRRLLDIHYLERECRKLDAVNSARAMSDMQARLHIAHKQHTSSLRWKYIAAACVFLLCTAVGITLWNTYYLPQKAHNPLTDTADILQLPPGKTQATLVKQDGTVLRLDADSVRNSYLLSQQYLSDSKERASQINELTIPRGGEFKIVLEDSTVVWLNAESQLVYPESFARGERRVKLSGEAYFKVAHDSKRPFYVEAGGMAVKVYGTEFNIQAYNDDNAVYTTLVSGSIALLPSAESMPELLLTPGHQAIFRNEDRSTSVRPVDTNTVISWHNGHFSFEEQTLEQILRMLSRWYNFDYEIKDKELAKTIFKGNAERYVQLSEILTVLEKSGGIRFHIKKDKVIAVPR